MSELGKVTAFVVTEERPRHLLVFEHPTAGLQLPAGTVEPGEEPIAAARREVWEETGIEVASRGVVLGEQVTHLEPRQAALLETVERGEQFFRRGHQVKVLGHDEARGVARIREEIVDYDASPPKLLSSMDGEVPDGALARRIRRTFVMFVEQVDMGEPWIRRADGHDFEVRWTRLSREIALVEGLKNQKEWLASHYDRLRAALQTEREA